MLFRKEDGRIHGETTLVELGPQDLRVAGMGEKHGKHQDGETGREMPAFALAQLADQLDTPLELAQSFLESARGHFAVEPFTHCHTDAGDSDDREDRNVPCREQGKVRPTQQQKRVSQSSRVEVPHGGRDRQDQQSFEIGGCERVKVNRLEFADPCKVKGRSADIARYEYGDDSHRD